MPPYAPAAVWLGCSVPSSGNPSTWLTGERMIRLSVGGVKRWHAILRSLRVPVASRPPAPLLNSRFAALKDLRDAALHVRVAEYARNYDSKYAVREPARWLPSLPVAGSRSVSPRRSS